MTVRNSFGSVPVLDFAKLFLGGLESLLSAIPSIDNIFPVTFPPKITYRFYCVYHGKK